MNGLDERDYTRPVLLLARLTVTEMLDEDHDLVDQELGVSTGELCQVRSDGRMVTPDVDIAP